MLPACAMVAGVQATVAGVERDLIAKKCGTAGCHAPPAGGSTTTDLQTLPIYDRLRGAAPKGTTCATGMPTTKIVEAMNATRSLMNTKLDGAPKCADGAAGGTSMALLSNLGAAEVACLRAYVQAVAATR